MDGYEFLPYQLAAMLLAFGVLLAIAYVPGIRDKDRQAASPALGVEPAGNQGQPAETLNSATGDHPLCAG